LLSDASIVAVFDTNWLRMLITFSLFVVPDKPETFACLGRDGKCPKIHHQ
jgi:hypothetical protein